MKQLAGGPSARAPFGVASTAGAGVDARRPFTELRAACKTYDTPRGQVVAVEAVTSLGVIGAILAEFVASDRGWGYPLVQSSGTLETTIMFSIVIILAVVASVLFYIVNFAESFFVSWHASQRAR